jgi:hypothetical protein
VNVDHAAHREYYDENDQPKKRKVESGEEDTAGTAIFTQVGYLVVILSLNVS